MSARFLTDPLLRGLRRFGRPVHWTPAGVNLGNYLYLWQHASQARRQGVRESVVLHEPLIPWLEVFPALRELSVARDRVRLWDQRVLEPDQSEFGVNFTAADLEQFVPERLLTSRRFVEALDEAYVPEEMVVNVRRGDYYSDPRFRPVFGFDQVAYLRIAVARSVAAHGRPPSIRVVSDGLDWCREHLGWLSDTAPTSFGSLGDGPLGDLAQVSSADRMVITNSTFSYWAGYISGVRSQGRAEIRAPRFCRRDIDAGRAWQLHPDWQIVEDLPNGWDEPG